MKGKLAAVDSIIRFHRKMKRMCSSLYTTVQALRCILVHDSSSSSCKIYNYNSREM